MGKGQGGAWDGSDEEDHGDAPASKGSLKKAGNGGGLTFSKVDTRLGEQPLIGKCRRSPITGTISLCTKATFPDFQLVDLFTRPYLDGDIMQHALDEYLFRPVPLLYRTWLYHQYFRQNIVLEDNSGHAMIALALSQRCIDIPASAGRWSSMLCLSPMILALSVVSDTFLMIFAMMHFAFVALVTLATNNQEMYGYTRLLTLPARFGFLGLIVWRLQSMATVDTLAQIGTGLAILLWIVDVAGDLDQLRNYRHLCHYEVIRVLPNRILICKRVGDGHYEDDFGKRDPVPETISGQGEWDPKLHLVADLFGILVELRPLREVDWKRMADDRDAKARKIWRYVGLNLYSEKVPSMRAKDEADKKRRLKAQNGDRDALMVNNL